MKHYTSKKFRTKREAEDEEKRFPQPVDHAHFGAGQGLRSQLFQIHERSEEGRHRAEPQDAF